RDLIVTGVQTCALRSLHTEGRIFGNSPTEQRECRAIMQVRPPRPEDEPNLRRCRVCGMEAALTFEHVPPRGAFNRSRAEMRGMRSEERRVGKECGVGW